MPQPSPAKVKSTRAHRNTRKHTRSPASQEAYELADAFEVCAEVSRSCRMHKIIRVKSRKKNKPCPLPINCLKETRVSIAWFRSFQPEGQSILCRAFKRCIAISFVLFSCHKALDKLSEIWILTESLLDFPLRTNHKGVSPIRNEFR